jgi:hypothetical protein
MGFLDRVAAKAFRQDEQGRDVYFFWGRFGKGRIVPSPEEGAWVRRYLKIAFVAMLVAGVAIQLAVGPRDMRLLSLLGLVISFLVVGGTPLWLRVRNWPVSDLPRFGDRRS